MFNFLSEANNLPSPLKVFFIFQQFPVYAFIQKKKKKASGNNHTEEDASCIDSTSAAHSALKNRLTITNPSLIL